MSVFEVMHGIQDARAQIAAWGLSLDSLLWIAGLAALAFLFTLRELLGWFLRLGEIRRDLRDIKAQLATLNGPVAPAPVVTDAVAEKSEAAVALDLKGPERL